MWNACPEGWHVPTSDEWIQLVNYLGANGYSYNGMINSTYIAASMVANFSWTSSTNEGAAGNTDYPEYRYISGFNALAGGIRNLSGEFSNLGEVCYFWTRSSRPFYSDSYYVRKLSYDSRSVLSDTRSGAFGFYVRCVKDVEVE
jgi:uncharacterized protein (TIGR02145 family)